MASLSSKKQAGANVATLRELHYFSLAINLVVLAAIYVLHRPNHAKRYFVLSVPAWMFQYLLEKHGRPKYSTDPAFPDRKTLVAGGDNIKLAGLFEYYFDIIYVTWIIDILMVIFGTTKVWHLYWAVPGFAAYKLWGFARGFIPSLLGSRRNGDTIPVDSQETSQSKRQAKLEARQKKGPVARYR